MILKQTDLFMIFGKRGSGKSTLGKQLQKAFPRRIVLDLMHEYKADSKNKFSFEVNTVENLARVMIAIQKNGISKFEIIFKRPINRDLSESDMETLFQLVYNFGDVLLVIEEIHTYMKREWMPLWLKNLTTLGRHKGVGIMGTSQRPAEVSKTFVSMCSHVFVGRMFERNDVNYFLNSTNIPENKLRNIEPFHFFRVLNGELKGIVKTNPKNI